MHVTIDAKCYDQRRLEQALADYYANPVIHRNGQRVLVELDIPAWTEQDIIFFSNLTESDVIGYWRMTETA